MYTLRRGGRSECTYLIVVAVLVDVTFVTVILGNAVVTSTVVVLAGRVVVEVMGFYLEALVNTFSFNSRSRMSQKGIVDPGIFLRFMLPHSFVRYQSEIRTNLSMVVLTGIPIASVAVVAISTVEVIVSW